MIGQTIGQTIGQIIDYVIDHPLNYVVNMFISLTNSVMYLSSILPTSVFIILCVLCFIFVLAFLCASQVMSLEHKFNGIIHYIMSYIFVTIILFCYFISYIFTNSPLDTFMSFMCIVTGLTTGKK